MRRAVARWPLASLLLGSVVTLGCPGDERVSPVVSCEVYLERVCAHAARCGVLDPESCAGQMSDAIDCAQARDTSPGYGECLDALDEAACPASGAPYRVPDVCQGAVRVGGSG